MALTKITSNLIGSNAIGAANITDASITAADLHATLDLTGKTVTVATASAGDSDTSVASTAFVTTAINNLIDSAPSTMNTLDEIAAALNDDANAYGTLNTAITLKAPLASPTFTGTLTASGDATIAGTTKLDGGNGYFRDGVGNSFSSGWDANTDDHSTWINFEGYQGGTTRFRDLRIGTGKQASFVHFDGSAAAVNISGTLAVNSAATNVVASFTSTDGTGAIQLADNSGNVELAAIGNDFHVMNAGGAAKFVVQSDGDVGIGVTGPTALLDVRGSGTSNQRMHLISTALQNGGDVDFLFGRDNGTALCGQLGYYYNTTQGARYIQLRNFNRPLGITVNDSGRVGIGNAVSHNFHDKAANLVVGSGAAGGITYWGGTNESWYAFARDDAVNSDAYDGGMSYNGDRHLKFHTNAGSVRMRIDGSGDGQFYGNWALEDNKKLTLGGGADFEIFHDASDSYIKDVGTGNLLIQGSDIYMGNTSSNHAFVIRSDGNVGIGQTGPTSASYTFAQKLVVGDGDDNDGITIQSGSGHQGNLAFNHSDGTTAYGRISYQHGTNYMQFYVNNALRMQINKNGLNGQVLANGNASSGWGQSGTWNNAYDAVSDPVGTRFFYYLDIQGLDGYTSWGYVFKDRNGRWRVQAERTAGTNFRVESGNRYFQVQQNSGANQTNSAGAFRLTRLMGHTTTT